MESKKIIPEEISSIFNICNMCRTDFNLNAELKAKFGEILKTNSQNEEEKFFGIVMEHSREKKKIKILKIKNDPNYLTELFKFLKDNLTISHTGMCKTANFKSKVTLHSDEKDLLDNPIKLCIKKSKFIVEKVSNNNKNIRKNIKYNIGSLVQFKGNTNNIINNSNGQSGGIEPTIICGIVIGIITFFILLKGMTQRR